MAKLNDTPPTCGSCPFWHEADARPTFQPAILGAAKVGECRGGPLQVIANARGVASMYPPTGSDCPACAKHPGYVPER